MHHRVGHPTHQILAVADLRIHRAGRSEHRAARKIAEIGGDGGRADVDRDAIGVHHESRPDRDDLPLVAEGDGHGPAAGTHSGLHGLEHGKIGGGAGDAPLLGQRLLQAPEVARGLAHVRLADRDRMQTHDGVDDDRPLLGGLSHDLTVDLALGRHVDGEVATDRRLAAEPAPGRERAPLVDEALLDRAPRARVVEPGFEGMLGEVAFGDVDLAAAADTAPAADGIEVDPEPAGRIEQARSVGECAALARRGEDDAAIRHDGFMPRRRRAPGLGTPQSHQAR